MFIDIARNTHKGDNNLYNLSLGNESASIVLKVEKKDLEEIKKKIDKVLSENTPPNFVWNPRSQRHERVGGSQIGGDING